MYRIAIITDIHGNIHGLNAVLNHIKNNAIDHIYCLGDMIGIGPFSNEVLETLLDLNNVSMITGNHDEAVLALINNAPYPSSRESVIPHHEWIAERLNKFLISHLEKLPRFIDFTINELPLHLIHYPMMPKTRNAHISEDPFDQTGMPSSKNFSYINDLDKFSLICFGHDHNEHQLTCNNTMFYNPGSLGCYNQPYARYGIIEIENHGYKIDQKYVPYDFDSFLEAISKSNMPRKEITLNLFS